MNVSIFGTGYVGLVTGACLADFGNKVICMDTDREKINNLRRGISPIYEEGLNDILKRNLEKDRLFFTPDVREAIEKSDILFITVGTPQGEDGKADLTYVEEVAKDIGRYINGYKIIVDKSTVPVGTAKKIKEIIKETMNHAGGSYHFDIISNPEFLKEGTAVQDFKKPERIVLGAENIKAAEVIRELYSSGRIRIGHPIIVTNLETAELSKYVCNNLLALKISAMNLFSRLSEKVGADIKAVSTIAGLDSRIGERFLQAGAGYGGSCFPKDVRALINTMKENNINPNLLEEMHTINELQKEIPVNHLKSMTYPLQGKIITLWGLSFKPKTTDIREAASLTIIKKLKEEGATIHAYDPETNSEAKKIFPDIVYFDNPYNAVRGANGLILVTEWDEFRGVDFTQIANLMKERNIVDARNIYNPDLLRAMGFKYKGIGR